MHVRHVTMADDEDGGDGISRSPTRRSSSITKTKIGMKKDPLQGSLHSETTTETKQKRRNSLQSQKSHNSQTSRNSLESKGLDEFGQNSHRFNGSTNFHASHQFNASVQQFHGSTTFSGSSVASKQSQFSSAENVPATPNHSGASRGSVGRKKSSSVPSTPISHMSSTTSSSAKHSPKVLRKGNPQTPPGAATPTTNPARRKLKKKPAEEGNGTTERSTSTRTSYITNNSSLNDSQHRHQFSSDDEGVRPKGSPVKKRRPKVAGEPVSPLRRSSTIVMTPSSPQVTGHHHSGSPDSPVSASPSAKGRRLIKKKKPIRKTDDTEPQRRSTFRTMSQRTDDGGNDVFYSSSDDMERGLSTDDEDYQVAPRQTPRPVRRMKKKPIRASSEPQTPLQHSKAQVSYDHIPETPAGQREVPSHIGRTPVRSASMVSTSDEEMRIAPSRRTSFDTHFTHTSAMTNGSTSNTTKLYEHARRCQWDDVMREVEANPRDAKTVGEKDGTTALHLAVMSRTNPMMRDGRVGEFKPAPLELIEMLVKACPEAASTRCTRKRYTPLAYACLVADHGYDMDDCSEMVLILLKHAPGSVFVFTDDGFSAVDIHILSYSQIHKQKEEVYSGGRTSTVVLRTLLAEQPDLAESRVYKHKVRGPIELLYRCNTSEFQDAMIDDLTGDASDVKKKQLKSRFGSVASVLSDWWAWKWVLLLLKFSTIKDKKPGTIFSAVQAAARLVACPLPILALAINTFPHQVEERDPRGDIYNVSFNTRESGKGFS